METSTEAPALTIASLGTALALARIIESAREDYLWNNQRYTAAVIVGFEELVPAFEGTDLVSWLETARDRWVNQSPAQSHSLKLSEYQAAFALEQLAKSSS